MRRLVLAGVAFLALVILMPAASFAVQCSLSDGWQDPRTVKAPSAYEATGRKYAYRHFMHFFVNYEGWNMEPNDAGSEYVGGAYMNVYALPGVLEPTGWTAGTDADLSGPGARNGDVVRQALAWYPRGGDFYLCSPAYIKERFGDQNNPFLDPGTRESLGRIPWISRPGSGFMPIPADDSRPPGISDSDVLPKDRYTVDSPKLVSCNPADTAAGWRLDAMGRPARLEFRKVWGKDPFGGGMAGNFALTKERAAAFFSNPHGTVGFTTLSFPPDIAVLVGPEDPDAGRYRVTLYNFAPSTAKDVRVKLYARTSDGLWYLVSGEQSVDIGPLYETHVSTKGISMYIDKSAIPAGKAFHVVAAANLDIYVSDGRIVTVVPLKLKLDPAPPFYGADGRYEKPCSLYSSVWNAGDPVLGDLAADFLAGWPGYRNNVSSTVAQGDYCALHPDDPKCKPKARNLKVVSVDVLDRDGNPAKEPFQEGVGSFYYVEVKAESTFREPGKAVLRLYVLKDSGVQLLGENFVRFDAASEGNPSAAKGRWGWTPGASVRAFVGTVNYALDSCGSDGKCSGRGRTFVTDSGKELEEETYDDNWLLRPVTVERPTVFYNVSRYDIVGGFNPKVKVPGYYYWEEIEFEPWKGKPRIHAELVR